VGTPGKGAMRDQVTPQAGVEQAGPEAGTAGEEGRNPCRGTASAPRLRGGSASGDQSEEVASVPIRVVKLPEKFVKNSGQLSAATFLVRGTDETP